MANDPFGQSTLESMSGAIWYNNWVLTKLAPYIKGDILEVGCGIGNFTNQLLGFGSVTAIDIQSDYIPGLSKELKGRALVGFGDIENAEYFFGKKKFDTIICLNVLEHIENDSRALKNLVQLLKPAGYLILLVPSGMRLYGEIDRSIGHFRRYSKEDLTAVLKKEGLRVKLTRRLNFLGGIGWWVAGRIFKSKTVRKDQVGLFNLLAPVILPIEDIIEPSFGTSVLTISQKQ
jgi:2-polyprenyl-3-methyl-5-hydroxy-6-metoxy-1,4-benzoquinol methylase